MAALSQEECGVAFGGSLRRNVSSVAVSHGIAFILSLDAMFAFTGSHAGLRFHLDRNGSHLLSQCYLPQPFRLSTGVAQHYGFELSHCPTFST